MLINQIDEPSADRSSRLSTLTGVIGGAGVILLFFWITLKVLGYLQEPAQTIVCHIPLGSDLPPQNNQNLPILMIGETGRADVTFVRNDGNVVVIGLANWGYD